MWQCRRPVGFCLSSLHFCSCCCVLIGANQSAHHSPCVWKLLGNSHLDFFRWREQGRCYPFPSLSLLWPFLLIMKSGPKVILLLFHYYNKIPETEYFWEKRSVQHVDVEAEIKGAQQQLWWGPVGCITSRWLALRHMRFEQERSPRKNGS